MDFMQRTFYREEPVLAAAGLANCPTQELLDHTRQSLRRGLSLMAVQPCGSLVGVAVNSIVTPEDASELRRQAGQTECPATRRVLELWALFLEPEEIWRQPGEDCLRCMLELQELATHPRVRGQGVALQLALASREVAADVGAPAFKMDCTSRYSASIAGKLGMRRVFSVRYEDLLGADGQPLFQPAEPHVEAAVFTQTLPKDCQHKFGGEL